MARPPKQLIEQIEVIEKIISSLNDIIDPNKIRVEYYDEDFLKSLGDIRQEAVGLRSKLEIFKAQMEAALTTQYSVNQRFASEDRISEYMSEEE